MRRILRLVITALFLFGGAFALAGPAVAAPAQPYSYGPECYDFGEGYQVCFSGRGVVKDNQSASGNTLFKASGDSSYEVLLNGEVIEQCSSKSNFVLVAKEGEPQVPHSNGKSSFTYSGTTCTYQYNYTYANGELRHEAYDFQCS